MRPAAVPQSTDDESCDVLVVGGGIAGCGVARDLALRGLRVVVVEKGDFGSGTTGKSTRIVHGGIRYLQNYEFGLVREGLRERRVLLRVAGHLVKPLRFVIPVYSGRSPGRWKTKLGLVFYDLLGRGGGLPGHTFVSGEEARRLIPSLRRDGLKGAYLYHDAQVEFVERLCLENLVAVEEAGGRAHNYCEAVELVRKEGHVTEVRVRNGSREWGIHPRFVVNATGPWLDSFLSRAFGGGVKNLTTSKGVHLFMERRVAEDAVVFYSGEGRLLFAVPWLGGSLVGTTDTMFSESPDEAGVGADDVGYLVASLSKYVEDLDEEYLLSYAGVRPLVAGDPGNTSKISRAYSVIDHAPDGVLNLVSMAGVKITEFRGAAEKVSDLVCERLGVSAPCRTSSKLFPGAGPIPAGVPSGVAKDGYERLVSLYGSRAMLVLEEARDDPELLKKICQHNPDMLVQVRFAVRNEHAKTVSDFMARRSYLAYTRCGGLDGVEGVARIMGGLLGWDEEWRRSSVGDYRRALEGMRA